MIKPFDCYNNKDLKDLTYFNEEIGEMLTEKWKDITGCEGIYRVSDFGRVKSLDRTMTSKIGVKRFYKGKILAQVIDQFGYLAVGLSIGTKHQSKSIARLVALAHVENPLNLPEVNHCGKFEDGREGYKFDNRAISLKWATSSQNSQHSIDNGLQIPLKGEEIKTSVLKEHQVIEFRNLFSKGVSCYRIAKDHNVSYGTVYDVIKRKTWKHLP